MEPLVSGSCIAWPLAGASIYHAAIARWSDSAAEDLIHLGLSA